MQLSAEMRWFWTDKDFPKAVESLFKGGTLPPGGGQRPLRLDRYLRDPTQECLGIKKRHNKSGIEVKGLIAKIPSESKVFPFLGQIELWCKWTSDALTLNDQPTVLVPKLRWLRKFSTDTGNVEEIPLDEKEIPIHGHGIPARGWNFELTRIELSNPQGLWWTLGFEAFGELEAIEGTLRKGLEEASQIRGFSSLGSAEFLSYPSWLRKHVVSA